MPQPCSKARRVPSRRTQQQSGPRPRPAPSRFAAVFKLDDPDDRRALSWLQAFHGSRSIHRLLDVARAPAPQDKPDVLMLSHSQPKRRGAAPEWLVLRYALTGPQVSWKTYPTLDEARAVFAAAVAPQSTNAAEGSHG